MIYMTDQLHAQLHAQQRLRRAKRIGDVLAALIVIAALVALWWLL